MTMNRYKRRSFLLSVAAVFILNLRIDAAGACEVVLSEDGRELYVNCEMQDGSPDATVPLPNLRIDNLDASVTGKTSFIMGFDVTNDSAIDTNKTFTPNFGFTVEAIIYVVSADLLQNYHYDETLGQFVVVTRFQDRISNLRAYASKPYDFGTAQSPRFRLPDRNQTYKIGIVVTVDPTGVNAPTRVPSHGEVLESNERDNSAALECLIYGNDIENISPLREIPHFHVNSDPDLPLLPPC